MQIRFQPDAEAELADARILYGLQRVELAWPTELAAATQVRHYFQHFPGTSFRIPS